MGMRSSLAATLLLVLAACGTKVEPSAGSTDRSAADVPPRPTMRPPSIAGRPLAEPTPKLAPPFRMVDPDALSGTDRDGLETIAGPADEIRDQPPAMIWVYREGVCTIEFYLFPRLSATELVVLGHKVLPTGLTEEERTTCLSRLGSRPQSS